MTRTLLKKICYISIFVFLFLTTGQAELKGNRYTDDQYNFEISVPRDWQINIGNSKRHILMLGPDKASEVGIDVFKLDSSQNNAKDVAVAHIIAYDGWQYVAGRHLGWTEKRGADTAFSTMYSKSLLSATGGKKEIIVQEFYFVKARQVYILTLTTDSEAWFEAKEFLLEALDSFKIK